MPPSQRSSPLPSSASHSGQQPGAVADQVDGDDDQMEDEGAGTYGGWEVDDEGNPMSVTITGTKRKMDDDDDYEDEEGNKIPKLEVVDFPEDSGSNYNSEDDEYGPGRRR